MSEAPPAGVLTIDLDAIVRNFRLLAERVLPVDCAAVVKADAYGLGMAEVAAALARAECRSFFVAQLGEGVGLRKILRRAKSSATIYVLNGLMENERALYEAHDLVPCLNDLGQLESWATFCRARGQALACALQIDTGMNRLGFPPADLNRLAGEPKRLVGVDLCLVFSHLACSDEADHPMNRRQLGRFRAALDRLPHCRASLAASSGMFLGREFLFNTVRAGVALYGGNPTPNAPNPMEQVVQLQGKILQVRDVDRGETVGYGATHRLTRPCRIATVGVGYADGFLRSLSNRGSAAIGGVTAPIVGRVSMDLLTLDVSAAAPELARPGAMVELIGPSRGIDDVAAEAGTIPYEILTALGPRYERRYTGGAASSE